MRSDTYRQLRSELAAFIPTTRLVSDPLRLLTWGTDASFYRLVPQLVVVVESEDEVRRLLRCCARLKTPNVMAAGHTTYAVLGLIGSYLGIYFYLRVIQVMFMSPDAAVAGSGPSRPVAVGASVACLAAALLLVVFPGWVIARI